jgi:hypothetical protein
MEVAHARLADELGADGDRLAEELDPAPIVLDPEPPPASVAAAGIQTTAPAPAASWLAHSSWLNTEPRPPAAGARV